MGESRRGELTQSNLLPSRIEWRTNGSELTVPPFTFVALYATGLSSQPEKDDSESVDCPSLKKLYEERAKNGGSACE